tara:strand:- start:99 stop:569 length:471 start_codon:yes stop_codon:yes gene_type:complete
MNSRVFIGDQPGISYHLFENAQTPYSFNSSTKSVQGESPLNKLFFSTQNVEIIHNQIINKVSNKTGYRIARQSDTELQIIMRSIFLQYSKNQPCNLKEQVEDLNRKVLDYAVNRIIIEISQYLEYKDTVAKLPLPLNHPRNLSNSGTKSLSFFKPL